jgi:hypothetical protein
MAKVYGIFYPSYLEKSVWAHHHAMPLVFASFSFLFMRARSTDFEKGCHMSEIPKSTKNWDKKSVYMKEPGSNCLGLHGAREMVPSSGESNLRTRVRGFESFGDFRWRKKRFESLAKDSSLLETCFSS